MNTTLHAELRCDRCRRSWVASARYVAPTARDVAATLLGERCPDCGEINPAVRMLRFTQLRDACPAPAIPALSARTRPQAPRRS